MIYTLNLLDVFLSENNIKFGSYKICLYEYEIGIMKYYSEQLSVEIYKNNEIKSIISDDKNSIVFNIIRQRYNLKLIPPVLPIFFDKKDKKFKKCSENMDPKKIENLKKEGLTIYKKYNVDELNKAFAKYVQDNIGYLVNSFNPDYYIKEKE